MNDKHSIHCLRCKVSIKGFGSKKSVIAAWNSITLDAWHLSDAELPKAEGSYEVITSEGIIDLDYFQPQYIQKGEEWRSHFVTHWRTIKEK